MSTKILASILSLLCAIFNKSKPEFSTSVKQRMFQIAVGVLVVVSILGSLKLWRPVKPNSKSFGSRQVCFVTAFKELERHKWPHFKRTTAEYFDRFQRLLEIPFPLVVFIDDKYSEEALSRLRRSSRENMYTRIIPVDEQFLTCHIPAWGKLDKEAEIMRSETYKSMVGTRLNHPEHSVPQYTIINHCKVDFVNFVVSALHKDIARCGHYAWLDFGYFEDHIEVPKKVALDVTDHISYVVLRQPCQGDCDRLKILKEAPDVIAGGFFCGPPDKITEFVHLYHQTLDEFQKEHIADDDQAVVLAAYFKKPDLFCFKEGSWKTAFSTYQDSEVPQSDDTTKSDHSQHDTISKSQ